jgi:hypothetical protein
VLKNVDPVTTVDFPAFLGLWYQMYADKAVIATFERDSFCDTVNIIIIIVI